MVKQTLVHPYNEVLLSEKKKKEPIYNTHNNLEVFQEHYTWLKKKKHLISKAYIL